MCDLEDDEKWIAGWNAACEVTDELLKSFMYDTEGYRQLYLRTSAELVALRKRLPVAPAPREARP